MEQGGRKMGAGGKYGVGNGENREHAVGNIVYTV